MPKPPGAPSRTAWYDCGHDTHTGSWGGVSPVGTATTNTNTSPGGDSVEYKPGSGSCGKSLLMAYFDFYLFRVNLFFKRE